MNTLFAFLVRRDQVSQLVAYLLLGLAVLALQFGTPDPVRGSDRADALAAAPPGATGAAFLR